MGDRRHRDAFERSYDCSLEREYLIANPSVMAGSPWLSPLNSLGLDDLFETTKRAFERIDASGYGRCLAEWFDRGFDIDIITRRVREATR